MPTVNKCINRIARCAALYQQKLFESEGLSGIQQSYILAVCRNPGISQDQLGKAIIVNKSNITRQLAFLEQNGFITREPKAQDKRVMQIFPTEKAQELFPRIRSVLQEWNTYLLEPFGNQERAQLNEMLELVMQRAMERVSLEDGGVPEA